MLLIVMSYGSFQVLGYLDFPTMVGCSLLSSASTVCQKLSSLSSFTQSILLQPQEKKLRQILHRL